MDIRAVKQRFEIIGNSAMLNRALDISVQVAPTNMSVLINGESGTGKENIPKIIHAYSARKHAPYIAVNCGAIPEGTIDSELFGHEKGSFTGATEARKGYFEEANGGTIFLDEVAELPLQTQVRLLRVLETGEYIRVGSSKVQKTNVRVVAATNVDFSEAIRKGKFREDLYYRLNQVPVFLPPLRERKEDIALLFAKFTTDFAERYKMPVLELASDAKEMLVNYSWPGNIRQLKNIAEQVSLLEETREVDALTLSRYLPEASTRLPLAFKGGGSESMDFSERDILYKVLFDMKKDMNELKELILESYQSGGINSSLMQKHQGLFEDMDANIVPKEVPETQSQFTMPLMLESKTKETPLDQDYEEDVIEDIVHEEDDNSLSLERKEKEMILKALRKHNNKRKYAANDLGISERTLYRKIKQYDIE